MLMTMLCECDSGCRETIEIDSTVLERAIQTNYSILSNHCQFGPNPADILIENAEAYAIYREVNKPLGEIMTLTERLRPRVPPRLIR